MNLSQRLADIQHEFETGDTPRAVIDVLNNHIKQLLASNVADQALSVGGIAPLDATLSFNGVQQPLSSFFGEKYLVLTWFRGNW